MATSTASQRHIKGILKNKGRADSGVLSTTEALGTPGPSAGASANIGSSQLSNKSQKWDEMNILATYHPAYKDYGLMNIDEPRTPHYSMTGDKEDKDISDSEIQETVAPEFLSERLARAQDMEPKFLLSWGKTSEDEDLRRQFKLKRKLHYNEGLNIKFAQQLIATELLENMEDEEPQDQEMKEEASEMESTAMFAEDNEDYDINKL